MTALQKTTLLTEAEYLAAERAALHVKSEFVDGEMYAMAGASLAHTRLVTNLVIALGTRLRKKKCEVLAQDLRLRTDAGRHHCYPDILVVCNKPQLTDEHQDTLINPTVIIEVLSPSTERWDRTGKFRRYQTVESLQEYLLVSQESALIERYRRAGSFWQYSSVEGLDAAFALESAEVQIPLSEVYEDLQFLPAIEPEMPIPRVPR